MSFAERISFLTGSAGREILSLCEQRSIVSFAGGLPGAEAWEGIEPPPLSKEAFQYGPSEGDRPLRRLFADQMARLGISIGWDQVLVTTGSQQGLDLIAKLWLDPGTPIALEAPTYMAAIQVFRLFQAELHTVPVSPDGMDPDALETLLSARKPRLLYLNPTFQNPSGICYPVGNRRALAAVLDRHAAHTVVIEDDPYRTLFYRGVEPPAPLVSHLRKARWVYLGSTSKGLIPGARIGYLAASAAFLPPLIKLKQAADLLSSRLSQQTVLRLLESGDWVARRNALLRQGYAAKRDCMHGILQRDAVGLADWQLPPGGMFFWLRLKQPIEMRRTLHSAIENGVAFMPGDSFFISPAEAGRWIRLNFTGPSIEEIRQSLPIVLACIRNALAELAVGKKKCLPSGRHFEQ